MCAKGFWLALHLESSGSTAPGNDPRLWVLVGDSAGLVASLAIPLAAAVMFSRHRSWWVLGATTVGVLLALTTLRETQDGSQLLCCV